MRRLLRSRPLAALMLALQLAFVAAPACAMAPTGHETAPAQAPSAHDAHAHHGGAATMVADASSDASVGDGGERADSTHPADGSCSAAMTCGVASLASNALELSRARAVPVRLAAALSARPPSTRPEPEAPPPRG